MHQGRSIVSPLRLLLVLLALAVPVAYAATTDKEPIVVDDPHYGEVLFYFYQEDYFPAIVRLLAAQERQQLDDHAEDAELLLGGMYLSYGHHLEAAAIFERMLADNVSTDIRDRTWFFLAKIWYQRGYFEKSQQALDLIEGELPENLRREALMLRAQILIELVSTTLRSPCCKTGRAKQSGRATQSSTSVLRWCAVVELKKRSRCSTIWAA